MTLMHTLQGERHRAVTAQQHLSSYTKRLAMVLGVVICLVVAHGARQRLLAETLEHEPSAPVTFAAIGDFGEDSATHTQVAELIKSWRPDLIITMGDNRYDNHTFDAVVGKRYCDFLSDVRGGAHCRNGNASENRFFPSIGNHEYSDGGGINEYLRYFALPGNERYYDFVRGPVHFFAINSNRREPDGFRSNSDQARWLQLALRSSRAAWKVVYFHHSPYSSGRQHGSDRNRQWPFAQWGADVVISGHEHTYERIERDGIVYFVNGLGGRKRHRFGSPICGSVIRYESSHGAMLFSATAARMEIRFESLSGFTDRTTLTKGDSPRPPVTGLVRIRNTHFGRYLQEASSRNVRTSSTYHRDATRWEVIDNGGGAVLLRNVASGRYLDYDRTNVDTLSSPSSDNVWKLISRGGDTFWICNLAADRYLDADRNKNYNVDTSLPPAADNEWELIPLN